MKYKSSVSKKKLKEVKGKLNALDKALLEKCEVGLNITRVIKAGKPYLTEFGTRQFATTSEVIASIEKLVKLGLMEQR